MYDIFCRNLYDPWNGCKIPKLAAIVSAERCPKTSKSFQLQSIFRAQILSLSAPGRQNCITKTGGCRRFIAASIARLTLRAGNKVFLPHEITEE